MYWTCPATYPATVAAICSAEMPNAVTVEM